MKTKIRDLTISTNQNLKNTREFNHLRVTNLNDFLTTYGNRFDYYESPFQVLADLERKIKFENSPGQTILCSYKPDGDMIFELVDVKEEGSVRIVEYEYRSSVS